MTIRRFSKTTKSSQHTLDGIRAVTAPMLAGLVVLGLGACNEWSEEAQPAVQDDDHAGAIEAVEQAGKRPEKRATETYIIVFKPGVVRRGEPGRAARDIADQIATRRQGRLGHVYEHALDGFTAELSADEAERLRDDDRVAYFEKDGEAAASITDANLPWGLDRIDQRELAPNLTYNSANQGEGVHVYVIDSGVAAHAEFSGRIADGVDYVDGDGNPSDCNGHGTAVTSTLSGSTVGVARQSTIHPVRVLGCQAGAGCSNPCISTAPWSTVIKGIDWVTANHTSPAVANMSISGSYMQSVNDAIARAVAAGVTFVVGAGNNGADACSYSPASAASAFTVGATEAADKKTGYSNSGSCVDIFAPGDSILSAALPSGYQKVSGTSMAAPHVAGAAALYLAAHPTATPETVTSVLTNLATRAALTNVGTGSPNRLVYMGNVLGPDATIPAIQWLSLPDASRAVSGTVTLSVTATDAGDAIAAGELWVNDGVVKQFGVFSPPPWKISWETWDLASATYALTFKAFDNSGNSSSSTINLTVQNDFASYDATLKVPVCAKQSPTCQTGPLVDGRGSMPSGPEPNQPNSLGLSCADGAEGSYHGDESLDRLGIYTLDGSDLAPGKAVRIVAKVWSWDASSDYLDLWLAPDASKPVWTCLTTLHPTTTGAEMLSYDTVLPQTTGTRMAIRGTFRYQGSTSVCGAAACTTGGYDDHDDLVFAVSAANTAPVVEAGANQSIRKGRFTWTATLSGSATDDGLPNPPAALTYTWTKVSGPGTVAFGTSNAAKTTVTGSSRGTYVLKLTVSDGALSASDTVTLSVQ